MACADSNDVSINSSFSAPIMPFFAAKTVPNWPDARAVSITPQALLLMTAVGPPDCAYKIFFPDMKDYPSHYKIVKIVAVFRLESYVCVFTSWVFAARLWVVSH